MLIPGDHILQSVLELFYESVQVRAGQISVSSWKIQPFKGLVLMTLEQIFRLFKYSSKHDFGTSQTWVQDLTFYLLAGSMDMFLISYLFIHKGGKSDNSICTCHGD